MSKLFTNNQQRRMTNRHRVTSIGRSKNSRPKNKNKRRMKKARYRGQGK